MAMITWAKKDQANLPIYDQRYILWLHGEL